MAKSRWWRWPRTTIAGLIAASLAVATPTTLAASGTMHRQPTKTSGHQSIASPVAQRVGHIGRWFVDAQGRVLIFHGGNVVAKDTPYAPSDLGFDDADAAFGERLGFTAVRLGVMWAAVEPKPGVYDETYLNKIVNTQQTLWRHGIYSLLDSHQDFYNKRYGGGGDGAPNWAVIDNSAPVDPAHTTGTAAWESFWDDAKAPDGVGLQEHFAATWRHVAARFRDLPGVVGIDILNEPPAGSPSTVRASALESGGEATDEQIACLRPELGCPEFDSDVLAPFYGKVIRAIRQVDRKTIINYEPNGTWQFGFIPSWIGYLGDPNVAFSYHPYISETQTTLWGPVSAAAPNALPPSEDEYAQQVADRNHAPAWIGEIGAGIPLDDLADADRSMQGYLYWTFWSTNAADSGTDTSSTIRDPRKPPTGSNINENDIANYVRPYPQVIAGTPLGWSFDTSTHEFAFSYRTEQPNGDRGTGTTDVYLPSGIYTNGYTIALTGGRVASTSLAGQLIHIVAHTNAERVRLVVTAR